MTRTKTERYRPTFISRSHPDKGFEVSTGDKKINSYHPLHYDSPAPTFKVYTSNLMILQQKNECLSFF
jgi:hypothetical protein